MRLIRPDIPQGISTIIVLCLFLGATNLLSLSFIAEYVGKMFEEVKQRPLYVVSRLLNFDEAEKMPLASQPPAGTWVSSVPPADLDDQKLVSSAAE